MQGNRFNILFALILILDLLSIAFFPEYRFVTKPLIMIGIMVYFSLRLGVDIKNHLFIFFAFLFALIGDILMINPGEYFKYGVLAFMVTHFLYAIAFLKQKSIGIHKHLSFILLFLLVPLIFNAIFWSKAGSMAPLILIYSIAISICIITAKMRWKGKGYQLVLYGALLFAFSDICIAIQNFAFPFPGADYIVMITYALAQLMIMNGYLMDIGK